MFSRRRISYITTQLRQYPGFYARHLLTRTGFGSSALAKISPTGKPLLIASLPRSGSSWVLAVLATAPETLPMHEPILTALKKHRRRWPWFSLTVDDTIPLAIYARDAFLALPRHPPQKMLYHNRWCIRSRHRCRPLVKEVLLGLLPECIKRYTPTVILLTRHPLAVAESLVRTGTLDRIRIEYGKQDPHIKELFRDVPLYQAIGRLQAYLMQNFETELSWYKDIIRVSHEDLCLSPHQVFSNLFARTGLSWSEAVTKKIDELQSMHSEEATSTFRHTARLPGLIGTGLTEEERAQIKRGWLEYLNYWPDEHPAMIRKVTAGL